MNSKIGPRAGTHVSPPRERSLCRALNEFRKGEAPADRLRLATQALSCSREPAAAALLEWIEQLKPEEAPVLLERALSAGLDPVRLVAAVDRPADVEATTRLGRALLSRADGEVARSAVRIIGGPRHWNLVHWSSRARICRAALEHADAPELYVRSALRYCASTDRHRVGGALLKDFYPEQSTALSTLFDGGPPGGVAAIHSAVLDAPEAEPLAWVRAALEKVDLDSTQSRAFLFRLVLQEKTSDRARLALEMGEIGKGHKLKYVDSAKALYQAADEESGSDLEFVTRVLAKAHVCDLPYLRGELLRRLYPETWERVEGLASLSDPQLTEDASEAIHQAALEKPDADVRELVISGLSPQRESPRVYPPGRESLRQLLLQLPNPEGSLDAASWLNGIESRGDYEEPASRELVLKVFEENLDVSGASAILELGKNTIAKLTNVGDKERVAKATLDLLKPYLAEPYRNIETGVAMLNLGELLLAEESSADLVVHEDGLEVGDSWILTDY